MVARGNSVVHVSLDESTGPSAALPRSLKVSVESATEAAPAGVENDGYWGIPVRPRSTYSGSFYAQIGQPWRSGDGEPGERSDRRHGGYGNRDGIDRRVEAVQLHAQDRRRAGHCKQSSDPDHFAAGNGLVRSGLALSAHLSWPAERQPHRHHGQAGGDASEVPAPAGRKLP